MITIIDDNSRFGARAGAIIYNENQTKILLENQENIRYMFPGGRIDINEDSKTTIIRELKEELGLELDVKLKYIIEMFLKSSKFYHEIGFYYVTTINENQIENNFKSLDGDGIFEWVDIKTLENYDILAKPIKEKIKTKSLKMDNSLEHLIYRNY